MMWDKKFEQADRKKFLHLIDYIIDAIDSGKLKSGEPLPTQRELAKKLDLSIGTITKAFSELEKLGYLSGEIGRGTFVRDISSEYSDFWYSENKVPYKFNLGHFRTTELFNHSVQLNTMSSIKDSLNDPGRFFQLNDLNNCGTKSQREVFALWLQNIGFPSIDHKKICLLNSEFSTTSLLIRTLTSPGDTILIEELTDPVWRDQAISEHRRTEFVEMDNEGIIPAALDEKLQKTGAKLLISSPTLHNPTAITTPVKRKTQIAEVCRMHGARIAELGHLDFFHGGNVHPYYSIDPNVAIYVTGMYFHINPSFNISAVVASESLIERIEMNFKLHAWSASQILTSAAANLIESGRADIIIREKRNLLKERNVLVSSVTGTPHQNPHSVLRWVPIPDYLNSAQLTQTAYERGLLIRNADLFNMNRKRYLPFVRISLGAINGLDQFTEALGLFSELLTRQID